MEPRQGDPQEAEGVLNPAAIREKDGQLYLFPRLVARGNYSRIGIARVLFDSAGDPRDVERMGIALEPEAEYELCAAGGGCEDPRVSYVAPLQQYVMTYTALSRHGPRIALAVSDDLIDWRRLGLASFRPFHDLPFDGVDDKDASTFPELIPDPLGRPAIALVHRPLFPGTRPEEKVRKPAVATTDTDRECIWISYGGLHTEGGETQLGEFLSHRRLACPAAAWDHLKVGGGAPPIFIGNSLPRRCGIATFTTDLQQAIAAARAAIETCIVAMTDHGHAYDYPAAVRLQINDDRLKTMRAADS
jgi:hypothetical protein